ncbi:MAG: hypothetical protein Q9201_005204 [Fulgogasparrea decipioides]
MDVVFQNFHQAQHSYSGPLLASTLTPIPPPHAPTILREFHKGSNVFSIQSDIQRFIKIPSSYLPKPEANAWIDIYVAYWKAIGEILRAETGHHRDDWAVKVYEAWKEVVNLLIRGYSNAGFGAWTMPCLYVAGKYLRVFAIKADEEKSRKSEVEGGPVKMETDGLGDDVMGVGEKNEKLEDAARVINRVFTLCISDRLLLTYLIPTHLHTSLTPPRLQFDPERYSLNQLFFHVISAIRSGSLLDFTNALDVNESIYVKRRIFLSLERAGDLCLRNLLRRIWLLEGGKEKTRITIQTFAAGVRWSLVNTASVPPAHYVSKGFYSPVQYQSPEEGIMENDEVECLIAGLIYKKERPADNDWNVEQGLIKGYISREFSTVVLNRKGEAFPGTGV